MLVSNFVRNIIWIEERDHRQLLPRKR